MIAVTQVGLGCASASRSEYLAAKRQYQDCVDGTSDPENCDAQRQAADRAARQYEEDGRWLEGLEDLF